MHVAIVGHEFGFPHGLAGSNYIRLLSRGLAKAGATVTVFATEYTERTSPPLNTEARGLLDGVHFEYTTGTPVFPKVPPMAAWGRARSKGVLAQRLWAMKRAGRLDAVFFYGSSLEQWAWLRSIAWALRVPVALSVVEWRAEFDNPDRVELAHDRAFAQSIALADGVVAISRYIENKVALIAPQRPSTRIPILCDASEWQGVVPARRNKPYVALCADFNAYGPDAVFAIDALAQVPEAEVELLLLGRATPEARQRIEAAAARYPKVFGPRCTVTLRTDYVPHDELRSLYAGAAALLAPLHDDARSKARFPSKLGDYLLSGRPVVSCAIGEVATHLKDGETAFLSEDSPPSFATSLEQALMSPQKEQVGLRGQTFAREEFDFVRQGRNLRTFLETLARGETQRPRKAPRSPATDGPRSPG